VSKDVVLYWSGGKDCAMALHDLRSSGRYTNGYRVSGLLTTLTEGYDRISGHGVRNSILDQQADCLRMKVRKTYISRTASMEEYEGVVEKALTQEREQGVRVAATGDIFIEKRRMSTLKGLGLLGCFPLQKRDAMDHMRKLLELGFKAYVVCVDSKVLDQSFAGRLVDPDFMNRLPPGVDPCGENGEYHTFTFDGPIFAEPVRCRVGEIVFREGYYFSDILPDN